MLFRSNDTATTEIYTTYDALSLHDALPISPQRGHHPRLEKWLGRYQAWKAAAIAVLEANLPLVSAARGVGQMWRTQRSGASSYFLGERRMHGWWYFYPVAVAVKTPLGFLMLGVAGSAALLAGARKRPWAEAAPVVYLAAVLAVSLAANVDVGVRYVLHVYPLLSLAAGYAVSEWMVKRGSRARQALVAVLVAAALVESWRAHPDYLPYFNALAGNAPERFQGDSDLDWGQDLGRLSRRLRELGVEELAVAYFGTADLDKAGLPRFRELAPGERTSGWIAVSTRYLVMPPSDGAFEWLKQYRPVETVGKTIRLYRAP